MNQPEQKCVMVIDANLPLGVIANTSAILGVSIGKQAPQAVGRDVLDLPEGSLTPSAPDLSIAVEVGPPVEALGSFRQKMNDGVRPISGSARQAFGFLLGPTLASRSQANPG